MSLISIAPHAAGIAFGTRAGSSSSGVVKTATSLHGPLPARLNARTRVCTSVSGRSRLMNVL
eukprot:1512561-Prymnesium_polylepis.1